MVLLVLMTGETHLPGAYIPADKRRGMAARSRAAEVCFDRVRSTGRRLMTRHAVALRHVVIRVAAGARVGRHRHGRRTRVAAHARDMGMLPVIERQNARLLVPRQHHRLTCWIGTPWRRVRRMAAAARPGRGIAVMTALAVARRRDGHTTARPVRVVTRPALDRPVRGMTERTGRRALLRRPGQRGAALRTRGRDARRDSRLRTRVLDGSRPCPRRRCSSPLNPSLRLGRLRQQHKGQTRDCDQGGH
jgi:hypothetical protein